MWKRWPVRMHTVDGNLHYIRRVVEEAKRRNIRFFFEVKEISYPEGLFELAPDLRKSDGAVCASDPFWWEWERKKIEELLDVLPSMDGIIVSPATRETKVSISTNTCSCSRCRDTDPLEWYADLLRSMYDPLNVQHKTLVLRDFALFQAMPVQSLS